MCAFSDFIENGLSSYFFEYGNGDTATSSNGELVSGWEVDVEDGVWGAPAIGDVDNDGEEEIVIASHSKRLFIISLDLNLPSTDECFTSK